ncbi:putative transmembrane protein [Pseudomonas cichorii]|uniref:Putative transmembrane protein n=1 Tax=Pseudomonas cichorii TaxID=36746 RepID=A0A3M4M393_PSECI|nr:putative transmembrane protein [Pseudomonas cichorii]
MNHQPLFGMVLYSLALLGSPFAAAQDNPADFASQTPLKLTGDGPWYRLELPLAVQLNSRQQDLGDLRVFNAEGQAQAYALANEPIQSKTQQAPIAVKWFPLYTNADAPDSAPGIRVERSANGTLIEVQPQTASEAGDKVLRGWLLDTSAIKQPLEQLVIDWSNEQEGFQRFSIEASDDLQHWQAWGEGQVARVSFANDVVQQREVALPGRPARYLRLLWNTPHTAPELTSAQLFSAPGDKPQRPLSWSQPLDGNLEKPGSYLWQLPTGLPVQRLKVDLAQPNSLAPGTLYGRMDNKSPWQRLGSGLLYRLTQNGQDVVQDEIPASGSIVRELKLEVDERGGGLGTQAPTLRFAVHAPQLVFLARGTGPFSLAIGNPGARPANLPLATLIPDYSAQKMDSLSRAEPASEPLRIASPTQTAASSMDWKRIGLWAVLVLGVALLGWMALGTLRASPPKPRSSLQFRKTPSGAWETPDGQYSVTLEGRRTGQSVTLHVQGKPAASFYAWSERSHEAGTITYTWTLGADPAAGHTILGNQTCATLLEAFFRAHDEPDAVVVLFDPTIENTISNRWGP